MIRHPPYPFDLESGRGRQRGNIYVMGAAVLAGLALLAGLVWGVTSYLSSIREAAHAAGRAEARAEFIARDNQALRAAIAETERLRAQVVKIENEGAAEQERRRQNYLAGVKDGKARAAADRDAVAGGSLRLRDPGTPAGCPALGNQGGGTQAAAGAARSDGGPGGGGLSSAASQFLLAEANRADAVVARLNAAREVIVNDRAICNGSQ